MSFALVCLDSYRQIIIIMLLIFLNADINECELGIASCSDGCTNVVGSYSCFCHIGYQLANDNYTCIGKLMI